MSMPIVSLLPHWLVPVEPVSIREIFSCAPREQRIAEQRGEAMAMNDVAKEAGRPPHAPGARDTRPLIEGKRPFYISMLARNRRCRAPAILQSLARPFRQLLSHRVR